MKLTDFDIYRDILKEKSGLAINTEKSYLLDSRLGPVARKWGFASIDAMTTALRGIPDKALVNDIVEAMTTNETSFFRDTRPFDIFRDHVLPYIKDKRASQKKLRLWCAAASTGQEPYTISMVLTEKEISMPGWRFEITATDISNEVLEQARKGIYTQFEVQRGLPIQLLLKYFTQLEENKWQINEPIRKMVQYKYFNLLDSMAALGKFDVIFCRNVLIYFDEPTKKAAMEKMAGQLEKDGFFFLGGAETVLGLTDAFVPLPDHRGLYVLKDSPHLAAKAPPVSAAPPLAKSAV